MMVRLSVMGVASGLVLDVLCSQGQQALPVVDLGVSLTQATFNSTGSYYSFKNIPYAEPPVGDLRFRLPVPAVTVNRTVNDGSNPRSCFQMGAPWFQYSIPLVLQTIAAGGITSPPGAQPQPAPQSEDCLLLDVVVPKAIFDGNRAGNLTDPAPVLVWIHGGGYIQGAKDLVNPAGLIAQSVRSGRSGVVFVAINYRLGLFGFPPRQPNMLDVASNAGLYDQRLALEWVRLNIHRFGGDPSAITVIGESAGAGSIVTHLTSFGGVNGVLPFKRAIIQSPAIQPQVDAPYYAQLYKNFLAAANVSSYAAARQLTATQVQAANVALIGSANFSATVFGPNVDGTYIPDYPGKLLTQGRVDKSVQVIAAHNLAEGLLFTDPRISDQAGFKAYLSGLMPSLGPAKVAQLAEQVYPPDFSGAQPYTTPTGRVALAISEGLINCYAVGAHAAYANRSRGYQFAVFPGIHAQDQDYTFFNGAPVDSLGVPIAANTAATMQRWFVDFAMLGTATGSTAADLPVYGSGASVLNVTGSGSGFAVVKDPSATSRCQFWLNLTSP